MRRDNQKHAPVRQPKTSQSEQSFAFRRSRTITGSSASSVRSATEDRGQLQSPRLHEHSLRKHRRKLLGYLAASLVLSAGLWYVVASYIGDELSSISTSSIQPVQAPLQKTIYQPLISKYLAEHPFERFDFALNDERFSQFMSQQAPEVASATLESGEQFGGASLMLRLREPIVAWTIKNQPYFVDADGFAYTRNYFATPTVVVSDKSGISAEAGVVASGRLLRFIGRVITLVNQSGIPPVEVVQLPQNSTREVDFKLTGRNYIIKAHLDRDPAGQAADIINAVNHVQAEGINPAYLDVRVSSKAYYRDAPS